ncbi:Response regulator protein TmoT [Pseudooceanicola marinus]|uniref:Response regulator protein TmoT n=2 Tax=Pseudooceanicola marinus TaxID=396013 RepID=A0A1X6Z0T8_9RHOB|nr:response regulator [Pseudooceanicola marinus]SLN35222.1 Response regulator protein TmoT [Pseudooceanicola marinus]
MMRRTPIGVPNPRLLSPAGTRQPGNGHCTSASGGDAAAADNGREEADFTVYLVDDDPDVRRALSRAISTRGLAVSTFDRAEAFLQAFDPARPGCLILDYGLPGMSGLDLQAQVVDQGHPLPIIFITGHGGVGEAVQAIRGGAIDFLEKPFRQDRLIERIQAARGVAAEMAAARAQQSELTARLRRLTPREAEIVRHMLDTPAEISSKEVGRHLDISPRTVDHHRARILEKLEVASVIEIFGLVAELPRDMVGDLLSSLIAE